MFESKDFSGSQNPGPRPRPLYSGRGEVELAGVFAAVAFLTVKFVHTSTFRNPVQKQIKVRPSNGG